MQTKGILHISEDVRLPYRQRPLFKVGSVGLYVLAAAERKMGHISTALPSSRSSSDMQSPLSASLFDRLPLPPLVLGI